MLAFRICRDQGFSHPDNMPLSWRQFREWELFTIQDSLPPDEQECFGDISEQAAEVLRRKQEILAKRSQRREEAAGG